MKRLILSTALTLALGATGAFAQQQTAPAQDQTGTPHRHFHQPPSPQKQAEFISKKLNLSPDQTAKLEPIFADRDQKFQALFQNASLTPEQRHEQMKSIHEATEQQLAGILSPDQLQQMKAMHHGHHGFGHRPGDQQAPPPAGL
jgi:hypothetical protein